MNYKINNIDQSNIKIVAAKDIEVGEFIGVWVTKVNLTNNCRYLFQSHMPMRWWETDDLGRYCNHSLTPNTTVIYCNNRLELKANRKIESGEEIVVDYRKVTEFTGYIPKINFKKNIEIKL